MARGLAHVVLVASLSRALAAAGGPAEEGQVSEALLGVPVLLRGASAPRPEKGDLAMLRAELHVHLDGSIEADELLAICRSRNLDVPGLGVPSTVAELEHYLMGFEAWRRFDAINDMIGGNASTIRDVARRFVGRQARSGVVYTEVRYDPVRLTHSSLTNSTPLSEEEAVQAVQVGLAEGAAEHGVVVYQLLCAMRGKSAERCEETARLAARMRDGRMGSVVGLDLAGDEVHYPNGEYVSCFRYAKDVLRLNITVHAGEFNGTTAEEVRSAVLDMGADRVGHGYAAAADAETMDLLRQKQVHVEACPLSAKKHAPWAFAAVRRYLDEGLNFGLNTDDPASFFGNGSLADAEQLVESELAFPPSAVRRAYASAAAARFGGRGVRLEDEAGLAGATGHGLAPVLAFI